MSSIHTAQQVLWLDPVQPLEAPEQDQLTSVGLSVRSIQTLDELKAALNHGQSAALVIRHDTTFDLLQSCQSLMLREASEFMTTLVKLSITCSKRFITAPIVARVSEMRSNDLFTF